MGVLLLLLDDVCDPFIGLELLLVGSGDITDRSDLVGEPCMAPGETFGDGELLSAARTLFAAGLVGVDGLAALYIVYMFGV